MSPCLSARAMMAVQMVPWIDTTDVLTNPERTGSRSSSSDRPIRCCPTDKAIAQGTSATSDGLDCPSKARGESNAGCLPASPTQHQTRACWYALIPEPDMRRHEVHHRHPADFGANDAQGLPPSHPPVSSISPQRQRWAASTEWTNPPINGAEY